MLIHKRKGRLFCSFLKAEVCALQFPPGCLMQLKAARLYKKFADELEKGCRPFETDFSDAALL